MGMPLGFSALFLGAMTILQLCSMVSVLSVLPRAQEEQKINGYQYSFPSKANLRAAVNFNTDKQSYVQEVLKNKCESILDNLDAQFNARREARRRASRSPDAVHRYDYKKMKYDLFEPEANCLTEERFGAHHTQERFAAFGDGPKFVCGIDMVREEHKTAMANGNDGCLVYSLGSNNNVDYERSVHREMGCETHTFDPTLDEPFVGDKYSAFRPWGIGRDGITREFDGMKFETMSIATIMKRLGHEGRRIDMLKMDIEGAEWEALPELFGQIAAGKVVVDQLQVEVHFGEFGKIRRVFEQADAAKMRIMHKERNHWGCDGYNCLEYAFVSEGFLRRHHQWLLCGDDH